MKCILCICCHCIHLIQDNKFHTTGKSCLTPANSLIWFRTTPIPLASLAFNYNAMDEYPLPYILFAAAMIVLVLPVPAGMYSRRCGRFLLSMSLVKILITSSRATRSSNLFLYVCIEIFQIF
jgi:hypothetical protein